MEGHTRCFYKEDPGLVIRRYRHQLKFRRHSANKRQWDSWPEDADTTFQDKEGLPENAVAGSEGLANPWVRARQHQVQVLLTTTRCGREVRPPAWRKDHVS